MLQERIRRHQQKSQLEAIVAAMPAYPIYREAENRYSLYIDGRRRVFPSEGAARLEQLAARGRWLRAYGGAFAASA
jgi:hypothetical protein